ncbi:MAG TPA: VOC family protein [Symbiobacteriaceae bacterium]|nr:VOC family protein [Symbiobacteriaceae bacterium]
MVYAVTDLAAATAHFHSQWGLHVVEGGAHPNWGTHNSLCHFGLPYVEFIAVQDPVIARKSDFGRSVLQQVEAGGGLVTAALATDDLDGAVARMRQNGIAVDGPFDGRRQRPDGSLLQWRMAWPAPWGDMPMPFLIQWQQDDVEREADLRRRGLIRDQRFGFAAVVYDVPDLQQAAEAFRRWYGEDADQLGIILREAGERSGPAVLCLDAPTTEWRTAFGGRWQFHKA